MLSFESFEKLLSKEFSEHFSLYYNEKYIGLNICKENVKLCLMIVRPSAPICCKNAVIVCDARSGWGVVLTRITMTAILLHIEALDLTFTKQKWSFSVKISPLPHQTMRSQDWLVVVVNLLHLLFVQHSQRFGSLWASWLRKHMLFV